MPVFTQNFVQCDADGKVIGTRSVTYNTDTMTVVDDKGATKPLDPAAAESLLSKDREERQTARLQINFEAMKADRTLRDATRLTVSDYQQNTGPTDLRAMASLVNDLRSQVIAQQSMILDLTRLVRGLAAED